MRTAVFKSYENGYFIFWFDNGEELAFEEVHPRVLKQFDLKNDENYIDQEFKIVFVEAPDPYDDDLVIYRVENLKPL
ncbi:MULTISPECIES: hypothetical protein [Bizionia]|uniref:DUF2442 domain-containing protein n=2 Tax=Bizionia TaxID=283785 RepID=A0A5D0QZM8_9FLAO|nr:MULTISPECIES: hypothetical protein [Bizionia]OBX23020.1 hypothetical protein BAA08_05630 [Bizionia sp. APA-3]TYB74677.1 hypothetical protein ES675_00635 [Bizionia algoritergicola]UPS92162.1 hypothetical protein GMA17_10710 [Bizionia sp. M204]